MKAIKFFTAFAALLLSGCSAHQPTIALDPGHTPQQAGALDVRGIYEVAYNDRFAAELAQSLRHAGWHVILTRQPGQAIGLHRRAELANQLKAKIFLSIHHDSAQTRYLKSVSYQGKPAWQTVRPIQGSSLYVSGKNPRFGQSLAVAESIGRQLNFIGRQPALHHSEPINGENRPLLNAEYAIYQYDDLAVLRLTRMPAVLLEMGVIVDQRDENLIENPIYRQKMLRAIVNGLAPFQ
ncbi:N-acetylmuramoyl-L-alanine amidase [Pasteurellaceae bacterium LIM206]|nr:N-acetylmuramoyl-L-alanine amidase [Pasteurellaceae bacterium LIM206]